MIAWTFSLTYPFLNCSFLDARSLNLGVELLIFILSWWHVWFTIIFLFLKVFLFLIKLFLSLLLTQWILFLTVSWSFKVISNLLKISILKRTSRTIVFDRLSGFWVLTLFYTFGVVFYNSAASKFIIKALLLALGILVLWFVAFSCFFAFIRSLFAI